MPHQSGKIVAVPRRSHVHNSVNAGPVRDGALEHDIETVLCGAEITPETEAERLASGVGKKIEINPQKTCGRLIIYTPATGKPIGPQPPSATVDDSDPNRYPDVYIPDNGRDPPPERPVVEPPSAKPERAGRGGTVPPPAHRFKPGASGNPRGRPRSPVSKLLRDVLEGGEQKYTKRIVQVLVERACEGSLPAIRALLAFAEHLKLPYDDRSALPGYERPPKAPRGRGKSSKAPGSDS